ncbi:Hypothetical protein NTJ_07886 [Nesidiocoris tenuis]|uniref:Uncharacterized protein n=1 Tax=Nesidiocoris tenuis TaxID=355587 RepID=A0ABN7AS90_9HEMI|nr:Hypothetical protein NTJ_07886 [Nesidiocoris tenuis]
MKMRRPRAKRGPLQAPGSQEGPGPVGSPPAQMRTRDKITFFGSSARRVGINEWERKRDTCSPRRKTWGDLDDSTRDFTHF